MGDRARVFFTSGQDLSPGVYLHWHGNEVAALLRKTRERMKGREGDSHYAAARFVGICHEHIPGNLSLGIECGPSSVNEARERTDGYGYEWSPGDAGVFIVNCSTWSVECFGGYGFGERPYSLHSDPVTLPLSEWLGKRHAHPA